MWILICLNICVRVEKMADTSSGVHRRRWQTQAVTYTGKDGRHKQWRTQEKMADTNSDVHRRRWQTQTVA